MKIERLIILFLCNKWEVNFLNYILSTLPRNVQRGYSTK